MTTEPLVLGALGLLFGMRHATDADHVVAVTTIVCRKRARRVAMAIGALWGLGHTVTILLIGGAISRYGPRVRWRDGRTLCRACGCVPRAFRSPWQFSLRDRPSPCKGEILLVDRGASTRLKTPDLHSFPYRLSQILDFGL